MNIILSSRNASKIHQIKAILEGLDVTVCSLSDAGIVGEAVEDGATLEANSLKKALFAHQQTRDWVIAEDTGLFIDALAGQPGIHAARWAGDGMSTAEIRDYTLAKLQGIPLSLRTASFKTVAALVSPTGEHRFFTGAVRGSLLLAPRAPSQPNMPYSGIFVPEGQEKCWAEMSVEEENAISHRGKAFRQVRSFFETLLA